MTVAKALANGIPIGAALATEDVASAFSPGTHGSTFGGNPFATAVGLTVLTTMPRGAAARAGGEDGKLMLERLEALRGRHAGKIKAVRGKGCLAGVDLARRWPTW